MLTRLIGQLESLSLSAIADLAFQNRTDTKFMLHQSQLVTALQALAGSYRVLEIAGTRFQAYQTVYFDTPDFALYMQHHAGRLNRYKLRSRCYLSSGQSFLELKLKTNKQRTVKRRVATRELVTDLEASQTSLLDASVPFAAEQLAPRLWNEFTRITLVSRTPAERLTLDLDIRFYAEGRSMSLPGIVIAELKQDGINRMSGFFQQMHAQGLAPSSFSKYCTGVALLYPQIKHNNFKPRLRQIHKLLESNGYAS